MLTIKSSCNVNMTSTRIAAEDPLVPAGAANVAITVPNDILEPDSTAWGAACAVVITIEASPTSYRSVADVLMRSAHSYSVKTLPNPYQKTRLTTNNP